MAGGGRFRKRGVGAIPHLTKAWSRRLTASAALPLPDAAQARRSVLVPTHFRRGRVVGMKTPRIYIDTSVTGTCARAVRGTPQSWGRILGGQR
jgi:hypothetical protein